MRHATRPRAEHLVAGVIAAGADDDGTMGQFVVVPNG
ncbi:MAG: hypothetical protein JWN72_419 [Thermoleophilia bacterium]|nr:hypothetical protein [Thermoleophilia bacterium]